MAKKRVNQAFIINQTKTQYEGFVNDFIDLKEVCDELDLENRIDEILDDVKVMHDRIVIPQAEDGQQEDANSKEAVQKKALAQLVGQLESIKAVASEIRQQGEKRTSLNILINWEIADPDSKMFLEQKEDSYSFSTSALMGFVKNSVALFCGGRTNGFPKSIKRNLDTYNLTDEYREFTTENSVMAKVDKILTDVSKLYTKSMKIVSKGTRYETEKRLEDKLDYEKKNLEDYGKLCYTMPNYSMKNIYKRYADAYTDKTNAEKAEKEAEKKYNEAYKELQDLKIKREELIRQGPAEEKKKKEAQDNYDRISAIATKYKAIRETLLNTTFKKNYPDLKELEEAEDKKYSSYQELLNDAKTKMNKAILAQSDITAKEKKLNNDIHNAIKNSDDTRLGDFFKKESKRYQYMKYAEVVRAIRQKFASLPDNMFINCDRFNLIQINKEIDLKIKEKKGDNVLWFAMRGMLEYARNLCPDTYLPHPLSERVIQDCEANGKKYIEELDNDELHQKIREYNALNDKAVALQEEVNSFKMHDSKDKSFWTKENKTLYKNKKSELEKVNNDIETLRKDPIYVGGASTLAKMMKESMGYASTIYNYNEYQVDLYIGVTKDYKEGKIAHNKGVYLAQQSIYAKLAEIYESLPDDAIRAEGRPNSTKKDSELKKNLDIMKNTFDRDRFEEAYEQFTGYFNAMKETYTEEKLNYVNETLKKVEDVLKDTNYEDRLEEYNKLIEVAEEKYSNVKSDYETKKANSVNCRRTLGFAEDNIRNADRFFERKQKAEKYDPTNNMLKSNEYDIDKNGDMFFMMIRQPFNEYYARKDYAKKKKHGDSGEYTNMITRLTTVIELGDDTNIAQYKNAISELKTFAQTYVRVRESQIFINRNNPMRKYRLSFAKGLIDLCEDQLKNLDGSERTVQLSPVVEQYLARKEKLKVKNLSKKEAEEATKAYNDSLDARKEEAIEAYKNSAEFKARYAYKENKLIKEISKNENSIESTKKIKNNLSKIKDSEKMMQGTIQVIAGLEADHARLIKELHILQIKHKLETDKLSEPEKNALEETLRKYENDEFDVDGKNRKKKDPEKKQNNIIIQEDEKEVEINLDKNSKKDIISEEEREKLVDKQLDELNRIKKEKKKKPVVENNNIINNNIQQDLNTSFDSIKAVEDQMAEVFNPIYNDNTQKNLLDQ